MRVQFGEHYNVFVRYKGHGAATSADAENLPAATFPPGYDHDARGRDLLQFRLNSALMDALEQAKLPVDWLATDENPRLNGRFVMDGRAALTRSAQAISLEHMPKQLDMKLIRREVAKHNQALLLNEMSRLEMLIPRLMRRLIRKNGGAPSPEVPSVVPRVQVLEERLEKLEQLQHRVKACGPELLQRPSFVEEQLRNVGLEGVLTWKQKVDEMVRKGLVEHLQEGLMVLLPDQERKVVLEYAVVSTGPMRGLDRCRILNLPKLLDQIRADLPAPVKPRV